MAENLNLKTIDTVDTRPFKKLVMTIGELPTSFVESMTYYELLAWFVNYLETVIIPTVNNNAEAVKELQDLFVELRKFVDDYFDNLDVQDEIDNKLDRMAEDGTLLNIFKKYMATAGILTYSTVYELSQADNLVNGSRVKTYGYKRLGDGVYDLYIVREKTDQDIIDGYNLVQLNDETLVAERNQTGEKLVIRLNESDNVQDYLNLKAEKNIILPYNKTIEHDVSLFINSDTELDLNDSELVFTGTGEVSALAYTSNDTFTKYNGHRNITIKNGSVKGGCLLFMHNQNVLIDGVTFEEPQSRHHIQIASCFNMTIRNCIFKGTLISVENASECINIDPCNYGSQPWLDSSSPMLDHYHNSKIIIENNSFETPDNTTDFFYATAIGSHARDTGYPLICDGIIIRDNNFGSPYFSAINISDYKNVEIHDNTAVFDPNNANSETYFIKLVFGVENLNISNNNIKNCTSIFTTGNQDAIKKNIIVTSNNFVTKDTATNTSIDIVAVEDVVISDNTFDVQGAFFRSTWRNGAANTCKNVKVVNNFICKNNGGLSTVMRVYNTINSIFANNTLKHINVTPTSGYFFINTAGPQTDNIFYNNTVDYPHVFAANATITSAFTNNNGIYSLTAGFGDVTSGSGTLSISIDKLSVLELQIGGSSNMQFAKVYPFLEDGRKFTTTDKTWRIPVVKSDGTFGKITLSITNSGTDFSWSGDVPLRQIFGRD